MLAAAIALSCKPPTQKLIMKKASAIPMSCNHGSSVQCASFDCHLSISYTEKAISPDNKENSGIDNNSLMPYI